MKGDLQEVERLLDVGANSQLKDANWETSNAEDYAARRAAVSDVHRRIRDRLADAREKAATNLKPEDPFAGAAGANSLSNDKYTPWPYETVLSISGNCVTRVRSSVFYFSAALTLALGVYLISEAIMFGGLLVMTIAPCLGLYPLVRFLFGGKDSVGAAVTTVVVEEYLKSELKSRAEKSSRRKR
ncbi:hypothetical protein J2T57_002606 [Natronocella acetinitrilica]|uniref:Uncharacterized protein n=2 Tax=Natronocella acetinitrilica TaxID=414046 RepID=A0AAE3KC83_9GAMM|nr:hypothetical protein [Natronocella acetinitrilica]MCP1675456.1 hypothetical protein [Natronocella acetinitrilica]